MVDLQQLSQYQTPQTPPPAPITPSPRHRWGLLGAFFVLALGLSAVAYFFLSEKYAAEPVIPTYTPRVDPMADWKTYTNTEYGFDLKYPRSQTISVTNVTEEKREFLCGYSDTACRNAVSPSYVIKFSETLRLLIDRASPDGPSETLSTRVYTNSYGINITEAYLRDIQGDLGDWYYYSFKHNNIPYELYVFDPNPSVAQQILSTFQFTTPIDTSAWKTYTNTRYSFQIKYPSGWKIVESPNYYGGGILGANETPFAITYGTEGENIAEIKAVIFSVTDDGGRKSWNKSDYCLQICNLPVTDPIRIQSDQILSTFQFTQ